MAERGLLEHPAVIVGGLVLLGIIVYAVSQQNAAAQSVQPITFANTPAGSDTANTNAAAIAEAAIAAGSTNVNTAAQLIGLENTNAAQVSQTQLETAAQTQQIETQTAAQLAAAEVSAATQRAITDSNNALAARQAADARAVAEGQTAAQRQATTDGLISSVASDASKVLSILSLGIL